VTRPFSIIDCEQRSDEWFASRLGKLTGSRAADAFMLTKAGKPTANRANLRVAMALERITGKPQDDRGRSHIRNLKDGREREPLNRFAYECATGQLVKECGFLADEELPIGVSLDGYVGDFEGVIECKSPIEATHLETFASYRAYVRQRDALTENLRPAFDLDKGHLKVIPEEYRWQIGHAMYCTGAAWCDYVSYHPAFPAHAQLVIIRVTREDCNLSHYEDMVRAFLAEVDAEVERIAE
jgi:hypothetical protein